MPDKKPDPVDATTSVSPQPSIDPVYQAGKTVGATDKSPRPPRTVAPSNLAQFCRVAAGRETSTIRARSIIRCLALGM
jgi:hypothetical protein